jgi:hypothetical protein
VCFEYWILFRGGTGVNSGLLTCKAGALLLEPHLQFILLWLFWRSVLANNLPGLTLNLDPLDLSLPNSWDYRPETRTPSLNLGFLRARYLFYGILKLGKAALHNPKCWDLLPAVVAPVPIPISPSVSQPTSHWGQPGSLTAFGSGQL